MIKLIATDLDGTLLLPDATLPKETFSLIDKLYQKGIVFCVASGRQFASLQRMFAPVEDKILFIAENGAYVYYQGECVFSENVPFEKLNEILPACRKTGAHVLLCCQDKAYVEEKYPPFYAECKRHYPHLGELSCLEEAPMSDPICKIALFDDRGADHTVGKTLPALLPDLRVIVSGKVWCDVSLKQTNKGRAMQKAQQRLNILPEECMAFGDYMNDYEMLLACKHSFVPENGFPFLKEQIGRTIPSNEEEGVIQKIKEVLKEQGA